MNLMTKKKNCKRNISKIMPVPILRFSSLVCQYFLRQAKIKALGDDVFTLTLLYLHGYDLF